MSPFQIAEFAPINTGHFRHWCAKLRDLPQAVLGIIRNKTKFAIECILDFLNSMSTFLDKSYQNVDIGGRHLETFGQYNWATIPSVLKPNTELKQHWPYVLSSQESISLDEFKLVKLTVQICQKRETLARCRERLHTRWPASVSWQVSVNWRTLGIRQLTDARQLTGVCRYGLGPRPV